MLQPRPAQTHHGFHLFLQRVHLEPRQQQQQREQLEQPERQEQRRRREQQEQQERDLELGQGRLWERLVLGHLAKL